MSVKTITGTQRELLDRTGAESTEEIFNLNQTEPNKGIQIINLQLASLISEIGEIERRADQKLARIIELSRREQDNVAKNLRRESQWIVQATEQFRTETESIHAKVNEALNLINIRRHLIEA